MGLHLRIHLSWAVLFSSPPGPLEDDESPGGKGIQGLAPRALVPVSLVFTDGLYDLIV